MSTLGGGNGLGIRPPVDEMEYKKDRDLPEPARVIEGLAKGLSLA